MYDHPRGQCMGSHVISAIQTRYHYILDVEFGLCVLFFHFVCLVVKKVNYFVVLFCVISFTMWELIPRRALLRAKVRLFYIYLYM